MAPSTSLALTPPEADAFGLAALDRFYRFHARIYDWTRPPLLLGRRRLLDGLDVARGQRVIDVGCGTGWSLERLAAAGARVEGVEPSLAMRRRAEERLARRGLSAVLHPRPYGGRVAGPPAEADRVLFAYSLTMIPPFEDALVRARVDLRPGGRLGVVDFLDAEPVTRRLLERCHVHLGSERLDALRDLFPRHRLERRRGLTWSYFLFWGERA
jgi:S-adenosylmethionine-diacylgycerolhomoserine-N-methlytransferase